MHFQLGNTQSIPSVLEQKNIRFYLDTEFLSDNTYFPEPSLLQVATQEGEIYIYDLQKPDIVESLAKQLQQLTSELVLFSANSDSVLFHRLFNADFGKYWIDLQLANGFTGRSHQLGLLSIIKSKLGIELDKQHQYSDWLKRPLDHEQLMYAATDVAYLGQLYESFNEELGKRKWGWLLEESTLRYTQSVVNASNARIRVTGNRQSLSVTQSHKLNRLAELRDQIARERNIPCRRIVPDSWLISVVRLPELKKSDERFLMRKNLDSNIEQINALLGTQSFKLDTRRKVFRELEKLVQPKIHEYCSDLQIHPTLLASKRILDAYFAKITSSSDTKLTDDFGQWRVDAFEKLGLSEII